MVKAFEARGEPLPNSKWAGVIYEVESDSFTGVMRPDKGDDERVLIVPLKNIVETEKPRVVPGRLFHCEVAYLDDDTVRVRSIEFVDEPPLGRT